MKIQIHMTTRHDQTATEQGFTIIELMIATLVFSVILVVITVGVLSFTNSYYRGVNSSSTQTAARSIADTITQAIQFSKPTQVVSTPTPAASLQTFCAGTKQFLYQLGTQVSSSTYGLYVLPYDISQPCTTATGTTAKATLEAAKKPAGVELLGKSMRLAAINVSAATTPGTYKVSVRVAYGDADLLCNSTISPSTNTGGCAPSAPGYALTTPVLGTDVNCKSTKGRQFCSVSALATAAQSRMEGN